MISRKRAIAVGIAGLVIAALAMMWPPLVGRLVLEEIFPSRISWDGKTAWKRCDSAIAGRTSWPDTPGAACEAMHMCANEAPLSGAQENLLEQAIRATPGCEPP